MSIDTTINELLPQTQCRECGYPDCKSYAEALADKEKNIGLCAPGGINTLKAIAIVLERDPKPYIDEAQKRYREPALVTIREDECIGCTKCIQACPVDAIIGASKQMHTILSDECTGCGLCIEPCPVDCIDWIPLAKPAYNPEFSKQRYEAKKARQAQKENQSHELFQSVQKEDMSSVLARIKKIPPNPPLQRGEWLKGLCKGGSVSGCKIQRILSFFSSESKFKISEK